ncbi:hypothetical protein CapIbe_000990 [Capra ibex]
MVSGMARLNLESRALVLGGAQGIRHMEGAGIKEPSAISPVLQGRRRAGPGPRPAPDSSCAPPVPGGRQPPSTGGRGDRPRGGGGVGLRLPTSPRSGGLGLLSATASGGLPLERCALASAALAAL